MHQSERGIDSANEAAQLVYQGRRFHQPLSISGAICLNATYSQELTAAEGPRQRPQLVLALVV